jgi:hypothetical protein
MSRRRKRNRQHNRPVKAPQPVKAQPEQKMPASDGGRRVWLAKKLGRWFLVIITVLGVILWWPFYVPNIRIDIAASSHDPLMPVPPSFSVANTGVLRAYTVQRFCYVAHVLAAGIQIKNTGLGPELLANILGGSESIDASCPGIVGPLAKESDIEFLVSYRPQFAWKRSYACARFVIKENAHGKPQWFRTEPQECKTRWVELQNRRDKGKADSEALRKRFSK